MGDALFRSIGDSFQPTSLTVGPWASDAQHGGAPAALLARAIERAPTDVEMVVARVTVELLRPIPLEPLQVVTEPIRPGRRVQLIGASLLSAGQEIARATGLKIRRADLEIPFDEIDEDIPGPETGRPAQFFPNPGSFATEAMEIMMLQGDFDEGGPGKAWLRLRVPVVEGEEPTGVERVAAAADFGNGVSNLAGEARDWLFINPDLEIRMARPPVGEWIYLDSVTRIHPTGTGLATSALFDENGRLGSASQSLLIEPMVDVRSPSDGKIR